MKYQIDSSGNEFIEVPFGWDDKELLRLSVIKSNNSVRFNKIVPGQSPYPGPEPKIEKIPLIIEALAKIYNDTKKE